MNPEERIDVYHKKGISIRYDSEDKRYFVAVGEAAPTVINENNFNALTNLTGEKFRKGIDCENKIISFNLNANGIVISDLEKAIHSVEANRNKAIKKS